MTDMENVLRMVLAIVQLASTVFLCLVIVRWVGHVRRELDALWRRAEWLERDADWRLSADRVELQQRGMQIRQVQKRVRRCEKALYINVDGSEAEGKEEGEL